MSLFKYEFVHDSDTRFEMNRRLLLIKKKYNFFKDNIQMIEFISIFNFIVVSAI